MPKKYISGQYLCPHIKNLGHNIIGLEIGVCRAENMSYMLENCNNIQLVIGIDPWVEFWDQAGSRKGINQEDQEKFKKIAYENLVQFNDRYKIIEDFASNAKDQFNDEYFDFIFVDGNHSYEFVKQDFINYYPKLKKGGLFCGHDFSFSGVHKAIQEVFHTQYTKIKKVKNNAWFFKK